MRRVLSFADGFTSSSAPTLAGGSILETYVIANAATSGALFTIDKTLYKTYFADYELRREDVSNKYIQSGSVVFINDGTNWSISLGVFTGTDMMRDSSESLVSPYDVKLSINASTGVVTYDSGTMGGTYSGTLKLNITRITI